MGNAGKVYVNVHMGRKQFTVTEGSVVTTTGLTAMMEQEFIFKPDADTQVAAKVVGIQGSDVTLKVTSIKISYLEYLGEDVAVEEEPELEVVEEPEVGEVVPTDFNSYTKKELITFIKVNNLPINTTKKNKAELLAALEREFK